MRQFFSLGLFAALSLATIPAFALCAGGPTLYTCNDSHGNQYSVSRFGNMTSVQGNNIYTGSRWNQNSTRFGNMTVTHGATNGNPWNETQTYIGGGNTIVNGTNSRGQPYSYNCNVYTGCR